MSQGPSAREPGKVPAVALLAGLRKSPLFLLALALTALLGSLSAGLFSSGGVPSEGQLLGVEAAQADRLLPAGFAHVTPVDAPDQDELETLSEQLEDPLLALGHHVIGLDASTDAEQATHGAVCGWAVRAPIFRSSSARGPPLS